MKNLNGFILGLTLTMAACNSSPAPTASIGAIQSTSFQAAAPSPTPTATVVALTIPQKIVKLQLNNTFAVTGVGGVQTVIPLTANNQKLANVAIENPDISNSPTAVWETISSLSITQGQLNQAGTAYLTATGRMSITVNVSFLISPQYLNVPTGNFYFSISNVAVGPWGATPVGINGIPFAIVPAGNVVTKSCGLLELFTDAEMTHQVAALGNDVDCGQI